MSYEAQIRLPNGLVIKVQADTQKKLFAEIVSTYEVLGETSCGCCGCDKIYPIYRVVTEGKQVYEYPAWECSKCHARLNMGSNLEGGKLFPQKKLLANGKPKTIKDKEDGAYGPHRGWTKWKGEQNSGS